MTTLTRLLTVLAGIFAVVLTATGPVVAADSFGARLRGFEEVPAVSTSGQGFFYATVNDAETELDFVLIYFAIQGNVTQAHIHVAQTSVNGGIVLFFCTNLTPPAGVPVPPPCPNNPAENNTVTGKLTAANVITQAGQGIGAGQFAEVIHAIKGGVAYANVHSDIFPGGEIRGQIAQ